MIVFRDYFLSRHGVFYYLIVEVSWKKGASVSEFDRTIPPWETYDDCVVATFEK